MGVGRNKRNRGMSRMRRPPRQRRRRLFLGCRRCNSFIHVVSSLDSLRIVHLERGSGSGNGEITSPVSIVYIIWCMTVNKCTAII
jgi:hypothetical protein